MKLSLEQVQERGYRPMGDKQLRQEIASASATRESKRAQSPASPAARERREITRWDDLPLMLTADHIADLLHRKVGGVKKAAQEGTLPGPMPIGKKPWTWKRDDWRDWYEGRRTPLRRSA